MNVRSYNEENVYLKLCISLHIEHDPSQFYTMRISDVDMYQISTLHQPVSRVLVSDRK